MLLSFATIVDSSCLKVVVIYTTVFFDRNAVKSYRRRHFLVALDKQLVSSNSLREGINKNDKQTNSSTKRNKETAHFLSQRKGSEDKIEILEMLYARTSVCSDHCDLV